MKKEVLENYKAEVWRFNYNGDGEPIILLGETINGVYVPSGLGTFFSVSPDEKYIAFEKYYLGHDGHAIVIKDIDTKEDVFILPLSKIVEESEYFLGAMELRGWTKDGKYFWGSTFEGAYVLSFFRIERDTWKTEIFVAPAVTLGGNTLNLENGWITYNPFAFWTGVKEFDDEIKAQYKKEGKQASFHLYNLFTKEDILLEPLEDPRARIQFEWISDNEVEYQIADGEEKRYKLP